MGRHRFTGSRRNGSGLNWTEILEMQNIYGWEIGSHSINGSTLISLSKSERLFVLQSAKDQVEGNVSEDVITYVNNKYNGVNDLETSL